MCTKCVQENVHSEDNCNPKTFHKIVAIADVMINEFLILKQEALKKREKINNHIEHVQDIEKDLQDKINECYKTAIATLQKLKENTSTKVGNMIQKITAVDRTEKQKLDEADASIDKALQALLSAEEETDFSELRIRLDKARSTVQENSILYESELEGGFVARETFVLGLTTDSQDDFGNVWLSDVNPYEMVEAKSSKSPEDYNLSDNSYMDCTCTCTDCAKNDVIMGNNKETCTKLSAVCADISLLEDIKEHSMVESDSALLGVVHRHIGSNIRRVIHNFGKRISHSLRPASKEIISESACTTQDQTHQPSENEYISPVYALKKCAKASSNTTKHKKLAKCINTLQETEPLVNQDIESTFYI